MYESTDLNNYELASDLNLIITEQYEAHIRIKEKAKKKFEELKKVYPEYAKYLDEFILATNKSILNYMAELNRIEMMQDIMCKREE